MIFTLILSMSLANSELNDDSRETLISIGKKTNNTSLINEGKSINHKKIFSLNTIDKTENSEYLKYLYKKYPESAKYINVNFEKNTRNIHPFDIKKDDLKINHFKYVVSKYKKWAFLYIINMYYLVGFISIFLLLIIFLVFLEKKHHTIVKNIFSIISIVLIFIYIYLLDSLFVILHPYIQDNLGLFLILIGLFLTGFTYLFNRNIYVIGNGIIIMSISGGIIGILNMIY